MNCAFNGLRYPAWVENEETPTRIGIIPSATYRRLHAAEPALQRFTFEVLSSRVFDLMSSIEELAALDVAQRLSSYLARKCDEGGVVRVSHAKLADHLGTAREVITRNLRRLEQRGLLKTSRGAITILDAVALADAADA
jgi:CRP/FNR family transcriptional regulator